MPIYELQIKAELTNIEKLYSTSDISWSIKFKCQTCNELSKNIMELSSDMKQEAGKGTFNLASRCHFCGRQRTVDIVAKSEQAYTQEDQPKFKAVVKFDCRGMEPVEFSPKDGWMAEGKESGEIFDDVDLSEKEWVDYDTKQQQPVGIMDLEHTFVKV